MNSPIKFYKDANGTFFLDGKTRHSNQFDISQSADGKVIIEKTTYPSYYWEGMVGEIWDKDGHPY